MSMIKAYEITSDMVEARTEQLFTVSHNTLKPQIWRRLKEMLRKQLQNKRSFLSTYHAITLLNLLLPGMWEVHVHPDSKSNQTNSWKKNLWETIKQKCVNSVSGSPPNEFLGTEQTSWGMDNWAAYSFGLICTAALVRNTTAVPVAMQSLRNYTRAEPTFTSGHAWSVKPSHSTFLWLLLQSNHNQMQNIRVTEQMPATKKRLK